MFEVFLLLLPLLAKVAAQACLFIKSVNKSSLK